MPLFSRLRRNRPLSRKPLRALALVAVALPLFGFGGLEAVFAPKAELWERWEAHDSTATRSIDHGAWDALLQRYLRGDKEGVNHFDYGGVSAEDRQALDGYIARLAGLDIDRYNRDEQFAYWANLYNALTIQVVLDHYPVDSIRDIDISPGLFADGPWDKALVTVKGEELTLNDIEHRILRPIWRDPRVHYAVNCASIGCPNLQTLAFTGATLDAQLEQAARDFVNSKRAVQDGNAGLVVSSIYAWFQDDFGGKPETIIEHLKRYAEGEAAAKLNKWDSLEGHDYDWSLNDASRRGS